MKKISALILLLTVLLGGCSSNITKYKINDSDRYFTEENTSGGSKISDVITINKIWTTKWLGAEKLVFDFTKDNKKAQIPYYTIEFNEDKSAFKLTIYNVSEGSIDLPQPTDCKYITQMKASKGTDCVIYDISTLPGLKFAIDEINPSGQLVINIKKIEDQ